jgi:sugar phosphate isomerase/epimerase
VDAAIRPRPTLRLACSNIAWANAAPEDIPSAAQLRRWGLTGIELAPTVVWPGWVGATPAAARALAHQLADEGLAIPSMQALLFGCPDAHLFDAPQAFEDQLARCAELGAALGAQVAVLGAPRQRQRGPRPSEQAEAMAAGPLRRAAARFADAGLQLALEPARPEDGGDFLTTTAEVARFVARHGGPGLAVHLDAAALHLAGETLPEVWRSCQGLPLAHYQISEPGLGDFSSMQVPQQVNLAWLADHGWSHWCAVEMRPSPLGLQAGGPWAWLPRWSAPAA